MKKIVWFVFVILCIVVSFYPVLYFFLDERFGLLSSKSAELLASSAWRIGFNVHIIFGGISLLVGWPQFLKEWRISRPSLHRLLGKIYVISVLLSATAGVFIGLNATGGIVAKTGFVSLGIIWFATTLLAYLNIKKGQIADHQQWMTLSYAACFAAVTLRLWLPLLIILHHGDFEPAYRIVAWLCWVPNLLVALWWTRKGTGA